MQKLMSYMRAAMEQYDMVQDGDNIALGLSGGKDSVAMLSGFARLRSFFPKKFELTAIIIDQRFKGEDTDYSALEVLCKNIEIPLVIKRTNIGKLIFEIRAEKNPCSLCARMRRGELHDAAKAAGCNKLALGHHLDDVAETFMMNLLNGGTIGAFLPVTYLTRKDITVIRPMIFARESDTTRVVRREGLPVVQKVCPIDGKTEREEVKILLDSLEQKYGDVRSKILGALQRGSVSGF